MMTVFPQLSSGAVAQFPFQRELRQRTLSNRSADGTDIRVADVDFHERVWEIAFNGLSDAEWQHLADMFRAVEGRLREFLFLEPAANLLSWSEQFSNAVWVKGAGLVVTGGQSDPAGGSAATRLTGGGSAGFLRQTLAIPAAFHYNASVWARTTATAAKLRVSDTGGLLVETSFDGSNVWKRYSVGSHLSSLSELTDYSIVVPAAASVDVYGPQLEAQPSASLYKRTLKQAGVYPRARFDMDVLADRATGVDQHSGVIRISWTPSQT
jgi:hypothetical protein